MQDKPAAFERSVLSALTGRGGNMKAFRQLTGTEKEKIAQARELYEKFLADDQKSIEIIDKIYGVGKAKALYSPERRALWRVGHEMGWGGCISFSKHSMDIWHFTANSDQEATDNDAYYMTLGASAPRQAWEA